MHPHVTAREWVCHRKRGNSDDSVLGVSPTPRWALLGSEGWGGACHVHHHGFAPVGSRRMGRRLEATVGSAPTAHEMLETPEIGSPEPQELPQAGLAGRRRGPALAALWEEGGRDWDSPSPAPRPAARAHWLMGPSPCDVRLASSWHVRCHRNLLCGTC